LNHQKYIRNIFKIRTELEFNKLALQAFNYQYANNSIYKQYIDLVTTNKNTISHYNEIPFLPIELFRSQKIVSSTQNQEVIFKSSGTTNKNRSHHYIINLDLYRKSIASTFKLFFGNPSQYVFLCLVPDFEHNPCSSLSFMCSELIKSSNYPESGFFMERHSELEKIINNCARKNQKFILFGLGFEILEFGEKHNLSFNSGYIIETGGTKRQQEIIIRADLHKRLKAAFNTNNIYSEYGMAELLTQSYFLKTNHFQHPPWKKILIRDKTNPLAIVQSNKRGCINIIDLANIDSCCFIATNDTGHLVNGGFNIIGRSQNAVERGCNLML